MSKLPVVYQTEDTECALACLAMIAQYHGHDVNLAALRERYAVSLRGASLADIVEMAGRLHLSPRALRLDLEDLDKLQLPAILHWDLNHFVVLKAVKNGRVLIHDPASGAQSLPLREVSEHFTGVAMELSRGTDFTAIKDRTDVKLSDLWGRLTGLKRALGQTLILSVLLQITILLSPFFLQLTVDGVLPSGDTGLLKALAIGFGGLVILRIAAEATRNWAILIYGQQMSYQMTGNVFSHLIRLPAGWYEKRHIGDIISRVGSTGPIQTALTQSLVAALIDGVMAITTVIVMFIISPKLAAIVLAGTVVMLAVTLMIYPRLRAAQEASILTGAQERSHIIESIRAGTTIKLFGRQAAREGAWRNLFADFVNANTRFGLWRIGNNGVKDLAAGLQAIAVIYVGAHSVMDGEISLGLLFAFLAFAGGFAISADQLLEKLIEFRLLGLHLDRLSDIVLGTLELSSPDSAQTLGSGDIDIKDLDFRYSEGDPWILDGFNLSVKSGEMIAITGKSGGGKTTLMKLMTGLYRPASGHIKIGSVSLDDIGLDAWRRNIGVVMQDDTLLSGSLAENIAFFDPQLDMAKVEQAARAARIHDDIDALPMSYDSRVGDMGSVLSGGQKQRVLLARALYKSPQILFLDEGTANLDVQTEQEIADVIAGMPITRIIIAHRPEFLRRADRVITL